MATPDNKHHDDDNQLNLLVTFDEASGETEDDLIPSKYGDAVTWGTDWTTETLVTQLQKKTINLGPSFQRRDAWTITRKSRFIESLMLGLPIPQVVLAERQDKRGTFIVLDGKQRLLSLLQFCSTGADGNGFELSGLQVLPSLNGVNFERLRSDPNFDEAFSRLTTQTIRTVVVKNWPNEEYLYTVFLRLNSNSVPLSPQELRKALHPGPFVTFADERSGTSEPLQSALGLKKPDFRMRDVEIVIRFYAFQRFIADYKGDLKQFLDSTCKRLNTAWTTENQAIEQDFSRMEKAISLTLEIFGEDNAFRKFTRLGFEKRLNRTVFDILLFYFAKDDYVHASTGHHPQIKMLFQDLCINDPEFLRSLETSTKTTEVVRKRFCTWGKNLSELLGIGFKAPL